MKKIVTLAVVVMMVAAMAAGCGTKAKDPGRDAVSGEDTSLQDIKDKGKFVLGLDDSFPPMGFKDENNNIVGFDIDTAKEVCSRLGVELVIQPIEWDAKEQELATKNIDCIWNGMSYNDERNESMQLSEPYMTNTQVAVVLNDSPVQKLEDLAGKTVVIQNGSTASDAMDDNAEFRDSLKKLVKVGDNVQAMMDLKVAGSDAVVMDKVVALYYMDKEEDVYRVLDETLADEQYVIGFRKGDVSLCREVEKILKDMAADGTLAKISEQWFGNDITTIK